MSDKQTSPPGATHSEEDVFAGQIGAKAVRKQRFLRSGDQGVWFGLGMSGLIGWSVAVPTVLGAVLGVWLDRRHPNTFSWTLTLIFTGLIIGCSNAWHWITQQDAFMREGNAND